MGLAPSGLYFNARIREFFGHERLKPVAAKENLVVRSFERLLGVGPSAMEQLVERRQVRVRVGRQ
jgi:hypothetical protein